ncbi:hypothetical protein MNV49_002066 [Pseudohyphozyma bogoriensis]|nr:hypothetical protein MNV49_002066 [Pseudohyphozyma bogoriensis]
MDELGAYRPRGKTASEEFAEQEQESQLRAKKRARYRNEQAAASNRGDTTLSAKLNGYSDYIIGRAPAPAKSRSALDALAYAAREQIVPNSRADGGVPSLKDVCIAVVVNNFGKEGVLNGLREEHRASASTLLTLFAVNNEGIVPFKAWTTFAEVLDLPTRYKTYKHLCLSDSTELAHLQTLNTTSMLDWAVAKSDVESTTSSPAERAKLLKELVAPTFFLATLDLTWDGSFTDEDMVKLRPVADFLVVLVLDHTRVTDEALSIMVRNVKASDHYARLEILSLKSLKRVTDRGARKVGQLPSLRMLRLFSPVLRPSPTADYKLNSELKGTSCTGAFRTVLNQGVRPGGTTWKPALRRPNLKEAPDAELQLFGTTFSHSNTLTKLRRIAAVYRESDPILAVPKPVTIQLRSIGRLATPTEASTAKTMEELHAAQLRLIQKHDVRAYDKIHGLVTSTSRISREALDESGHSAREDGGWMSEGMGGIAGGRRIGAGISGGRSLYDIGTRKLSKVERQDMKEDAISDWGSEEEEEEEEWRRKREEEREKAKSGVGFYEDPTEGRGREKEKEKKHVRRRDKPVDVPEPSPLFLLRHLPLRHSCEPPEEIVVVEAADTRHTPASERPALIEGEALRKKKRVAESDFDLPFSSHSSTTSSRPPSSKPTLSDDDRLREQQRHLRLQRNHETLFVQLGCLDRKLVKNEKKKWEPPLPTRVGKKKKRGPDPTQKLPAVYPNTRCKLKLLKMQRIQDHLLIEEEFVQNQERLAPTLSSNKTVEERTRVDDLRGSPMSIGTLEEIIDDDHAIVSTTGPEYYVSIMSFVDKDLLEPGCSVMLHHKAMAIVGVLQDDTDPMVSMMKVDKAPTESYADIGGLEQQIQEIKESVELPLTHPELYEEMGIKPPKGVILYGVPGTGKTLLAKAVANQTSATFLRIVGSELIQKYLGDGPKLVRELFRVAEELAPSIVFIDEIDAVGTKRYDSNSGGEREIQRTMLELLNQLDGFDSRGDVKVIMATNKIESLDPALIRPGRIDRKIEFPLPDIKTKRYIFKIHTSRMSLSSDVDLEEFVHTKDELSGADIKAVCTEAGLLALRERRMQVTMEDFKDAREKVLYRKKDSGPEGLYL